MKPAQAGALTTPPLPESCRAASSARIASRALWSVVSLAESAAFVAYEASSVASALAPWSAVMLASRLASCAATKASVARPSRRVHHRGSVHGRLQGVSSQGAGVCLGGLQPRDGGVSACELGGQHRGGDGPQESVGHLGVDLQRRDPRRYV